MIGKQSRHFVRYELALRPPRQKGPAIPFLTDDDNLDVVSILQAAVKDGIASYVLKENDTVRLTHVDVREGDGLVVLLVRRRDEDAATQVFEAADTGALWTPEVGPEQAPAISSHVFIRIYGEGEPHPKYRAIVEEIPGLGRSYIQTLLHRITSPVKYEYLDEKNKPKEAYIIPMLHGVPSETLGAAMNGGTINYIELVRPPALDGLDVAGLIPHPQRLKLSVKSNSPLDVVERVRAWALQHNWPNVRVQVETADDRTKVVEIAREADAADILFVRSEVVKTKKEIPSCSDEVNEELVKLAIPLLMSNQGW